MTENLPPNFGNTDMTGTSMHPVPAGVPKDFLQEAPPQRSLPDVDDLGLGEFQKYMDPNGFRVFITLMHYAVHQQDMFDGKPLKWGPDKMALAAAPFVGFGNPDMWEGAYRHEFRRHIISIVTKWNRRSKKWKKNNPLPWLFLDNLAADFASTDKGWTGSISIDELVQSDEMTERWKKK